MKYKKISITKSTQWLFKWQTQLRLLDWKISFQRISIFQVSDDYCRVGNQFVGISQNRHQQTATIHHTRHLTEEDIVHELLHVRYPKWSEEQVNTHTAFLLNLIN